MPTLYETLGVPEHASVREIKTAFRQLSMRYHPDKNAGDKHYEEKFRLVLEAYKILSDTDRRAAYNRRLHYSRMPPPQPRTVYTPPQSSGSSYRQATAPQQAVTYTPINKKLMALVIVIMVTFFVGLYLFGPKPKKPEDIYADIPMPPPPPTLATTKEAVTLRSGENTTDEKLLKDLPDSKYVKLYRDIDDDGKDELHIIIYHKEERYSYEDILFRRNAKGKMEEFLRHKGGLYVAGNHMRLYFEEPVETYYSCGECQVEGLPSPGSAGIYLVAKDGRLMYAQYSELRNIKIRENMELLLSLGVPESEENGDDGGVRKEYVKQIISFYFNNHSMTQAHAFFMNYYNARDRERVWQFARKAILRYEKIIAANPGFRDKK